MRIRCRRQGSEFDLIVATLAQTYGSMGFLLLFGLSPSPQAAYHLVCFLSPSYRLGTHFFLKTSLWGRYYCDAHFLGENIAAQIGWVEWPKLYRFYVQNLHSAGATTTLDQKQAKQLVRRASFHYQDGPGVLSREMSMWESEWVLYRCLEDHSLILTIK